MGFCQVRKDCTCPMLLPSPLRKARKSLSQPTALAQASTRCTSQTFLPRPQHTACMQCGVHLAPNRLHTASRNHQSQQTQLRSRHRLSQPRSASALQDTRHMHHRCRHVLPGMPRSLCCPPLAECLRHTQSSCLQSQRSPTSMQHKLCCQHSDSCHPHTAHKSHLIRPCLRHTRCKTSGRCSSPALLGSAHKLRRS